MDGVIVVCVIAFITLLLTSALCDTTLVWLRKLVFRHRLRRRSREIRNASSKRASKVLDMIDMDDLGGDVLDLVAEKKYVRCAVLMSREVRRALRFPSHSRSNEKIVCDWIEKNYPEGVTSAMKHRITPLAIKLAFVESRFETAAEVQFDWLGPLVDSA